MCEQAVENTFPMVSVIIPCRNEEKFIGVCLDSILANDYPKDRLEILVLDGMSEDGTQEIVEACARENPFIRLLENRKKITPAALNIGVANARGQLIVVMGAHATCSNDYITRCVKAIEEHEAECVGGTLITLPANHGTIAQAIAVGLAHPFGVGNAYFRIGVKGPRWVDTVLFGCYRREVFDRFGMFDERLIRNQDIEFNMRIRRAGGKLFITPEIQSSYFCRADLGGLWKQSFQNGQWNVYTIALAGRSLSWRHFVPLCFVTGLFGTGLLALRLPTFGWLFGGIATSYIVSAVIAALQTSDGRHAGSRVLLPLVFLVLHLSYGLGSLWGIMTLPNVLRHGH